MPAAPAAAVLDSSVMPTFCRHNRFIERCPICSRELEPAESPAPAGGARRARGPSASSRVKQTGTGQRLRVRRETRSEDDGYRSPLIAGLRSSKDALRLAEEIALAAGRLRTLADDPPGAYAEIVTQPDPEQASWMCFLLVYISPLQAEDPFAGIRVAFDQAGDWNSGSLPALDEIPLGPRTSHESSRGTQTLEAYRRWATQASSQAAAFSGEATWSPQRRFERVFERLAFPGFARGGRFDLLLTLGALGIYELAADSLHLGGAHGRSSEDLTSTAAKRIFAIGDPLNLERRAGALAEALEVPLGALDLAFYNWSASQRATLGVTEDSSDADVLERAHTALGL